MISPSKVYRELLAAAPHAPGRALRAFSAADGVILRAWVDGITRLPGLTVVMRGATPIGTVPPVRGFEIAPVVDEGGGSGEIEIRCSGNPYVEVFVELASRLVERARSESTGELAQRQILHQLNLWARFFESASTAGMSRQTQLGLIGELLCLQDLAQDIGYPRAVDAWCGPYGAAHDFQWMGRSVEAKLTTSDSPETITISSERQLEAPADTVLILFVALALETKSAGISVTELVAAVSERISAHAESHAAFHDALTAVGYLDERSVQETVRVSVRQTAMLEVSEDFPKITSRNLMQGVYDVRYCLPWSALAGFRINPSRRLELIA